MFQIHYYMRKTGLAFLCLLAVPGYGRASGLDGISAAEVRQMTAPAAAPVPSPAAMPLAPKHKKNRLPARLPDNPLIVVHSSRIFDDKESARAGIDSVVAAFKAEGRDVIYLVHDQTGPGYAEWYTGDRSPDYEIFSAGGENNLPLRADSVTIAGGFFGSYDGSRGCHTMAVRDAIRMHFEYSGNPFTVNIPIGAVYFYDEDTGVREQLLALPKAPAEAELRRVFEDFEENFLLSDNFTASTEDAVTFGHPFLDPEANPAYRMGKPVDTARYTFELFFNGLKVSKFGTGPRKVTLKLSN